MLAEELLELTIKKGVSDVEVYQVQSHSRPISFEANRLKQIESSQTTGIALRLWHKGCQGLAVAYGDFNPDDLISKALAISELNDPEEPLLNDNNKLIYPNAIHEPNINNLISQGKNAIAIITDKYPEVITNVEIEWETETTTLINSRGLYCLQTDNSYSASLGIELVTEDDFLGIYDGEYSHDVIDLDRMINAVLQRLQWAEKNTSVNNGKMPVLFTPNAVTTLWETISEALNGKRIFDKSSPWCESQGKKVVSSCLSLSQQPNLQPYNCPFDDEGTITQHLNLIKEGILNSFYTDKQTAQKLSITNTGNGFRPSLGSYATPDLINLVIEKGNLSQEKLIKNIEDGIIIDQILGEGADISGDFSFNIDLGYRVKKGEIIGRIKDTMLAGNVYQALQKVKSVGNDLTWSGSCYTPSIVIDELSLISG
ncbi:MAG: TldD/PmbA family protein [Cyanobacteria bacterium]|nr:TldD/PmbA family protein [Cyanobacteria bacterium CG_2015-16_32_12]NCO78070.1 TldD/PmbA family protein [Cyanobacteria bacterium CG_2015-22_32_23]NCQ41676.1 TldD/PmbA family protein [Cyanobacteria bacterium CG_2015-04_32_10]NCS83823.1 TldD/PmbA family protein [Cyanobacteria bacterium CG_2015-02_32_10]